MLNHQAGTVYIFGVMKMPLFFFSVWYCDWWNQKLEIKIKTVFLRRKNCANFIFRYCFLGCSAIALLFYRLLCLESPFQLALGICHNKAKLAKIVRNHILPPALIQMQTAHVNCIVQKRLNIHFVEVSFQITFCRNIVEWKKKLCPFDFMIWTTIRRLVALSFISAFNELISLHIRLDFYLSKTLAY